MDENVSVSHYSKRSKKKSPSKKRSRYCSRSSRPFYFVTTCRDVSEVGKLLQTNDKHLFKLESELKRSSEDSHLSYFITAEPSYKFDRNIYFDQWDFGLNAEVAGLLRNALSSPDDFD